MPKKDAFDYADKPVNRSQSRAGMLWNVLTILVLLSAVCVGVYYLMIFLNPYVGYNPFPPPTIPAMVLTDTPTPTSRVALPPTWTPTPESTSTATPLPPPATPTSAEQSGDVQGELNPVEGMPFVLQEGSPNYIPNIYHPDSGCNWLGVAGQVISLSEAPLRDVFVQLGGSLDGQTLEMLTMSGMAPSYGQAGYEFVLSDAPVASTGTLWLQVLDQAGLPLSEKLYFDTFQDCDKNLAVIYFKQVK